MKIDKKVFILDVDGVLTTGQFFYSESGKVMKVFGLIWDICSKKDLQILKSHQNKKNDFLNSSDAIQQNHKINFEQWKRSKKI